MAGPMWKTIRLRALLGQACFFFLRPLFCFLGGFVEEMCDRIMSEVAISRAWADCGVVTEAIEHLTTRGTVSAGPRRGCQGDVARLRGQGRRPSQREVRWVLLPTRRWPLRPGVIRTRSRPAGWFVPSRSQVCVSHNRLDR